MGWPDHRLLLAPFARLCLLVLLAVAVAACGGNSAKSGDVDTPTLLAKTSERLNAVKSVHFNLAIDGAAYIDTTRTVQLRSAAGDIVVPDQMQAKIQIALGAANADVSLVTIGDDKYQTDLLTGRWGDFATGDRGGDAISLAAYLFGTSQSEAAARIAQMLGFTGRATHNG